MPAHALTKTSTHGLDAPNPSPNMKNTRMLSDYWRKDAPFYSVQPFRNFKCTEFLKQLYVFKWRTATCISYGYVSKYHRHEWSQWELRTANRLLICCFHFWFRKLDNGGANPSIILTQKKNFVHIIIIIISSSSSSSSSGKKCTDKAKPVQLSYRPRVFQDVEATRFKKFETS